MPDIFDQLLNPKKLDEDSEFYENRFFKIFGDKIYNDRTSEIPGGNQPLAYDRRFKIPIKVDRIKEYYRDQDTGKYKTLEDVLGMYSRTSPNIKINPSVGRLWQEGNPIGKDVVRHEIIHGFEDFAEKQHEAGKGKKYEPEGSSQGMLNDLVTLFNLMRGNKEPNLTNTLRKIYDMEVGGKGFGKVTTWPMTGYMHFQPQSHWPTIGKNGYKQYDKFTDEEQQVLKKFFASEAERLGYGKYKSLWE